MPVASVDRLSSLCRFGTMLGQRQIFSVAICVLLANAVATKVIGALAELGPANALAAGLGLSWAFWLSVALCVRLAWLHDDRPARPKDMLICAACLAAALVPISPISALASTVLAFVILFDRGQGVFLKASAMVLLAISIHLLWSRLLMLVFVGPVAALDAHMVGLITQTPVQGNMVRFVDGTHRLSILEACTSVQNASVALMLFVAIVRTFRPAPIRSEIYFLAGLFVSVVVINIIRLTLMAQSLKMFEIVHGDAGWAAINAIITVNGLLWAAMSVRREILA